MKLLPIKVKDKYGFIDIRGDLVIKPQYSSASTFSDGLSYITIEDKKYVINQQGEVLFETHYDIPYGYSENRCVIKEAGRCGYMDHAGNVILSPQFHEAYPFRNGYAVARPDMKSVARLIDLDGKAMFEDFWLSITCMYSNKLINLLAATRDGFRSGFVDLARNWVIKPEYLHAYPFYDGLAAVQTADTEKYGFIDPWNNFVIKPVFDGSLLWFSEGYCPVWDNGFGFIDKTGTVKISPQYYLADHFSCGLAAVKKEEDSPYGYIDRNNELKIQSQFQYASKFEDGVASVDHGYINTEGKYIWKDS